MNYNRCSSWASKENLYNFNWKSTLKMLCHSLEMLLCAVAQSAQFTVFCPMHYNSIETHTLLTLILWFKLFILVDEIMWLELTRHENEKLNLKCLENQNFPCGKWICFDWIFTIMRTPLPFHVFSLHASLYVLIFILQAISSLAELSKSYNFTPRSKKYLVKRTCESAIAWT